MSQQLTPDCRRRGILPALMACTLILAGLAFAPSRAAGQMVTYAQYLTGLAKFQARGAALIESIDSVDVQSEYCTAAERRAVGIQIANLGIAFGALREEWGKFKAGVDNFGQTQAGIAAFGKNNPNDLRFWVDDDKDVIGHPGADLEELRARFRASKVINCKAPKKASPPPPAPARPRPKLDPLAGLTRPQLLDQTIPPVPGPFCSEEERIAWYRAVLRPLLTEHDNASSALRDYRATITSRIQAATPLGKPFDQSVVDVLEKEERWAQAEHAKLDKIYGAKIGPLINWMYAKEAVIDCTQKTTTSASTPTGVSSSPTGTTGGKAPVTPVDTNKPVTPVDTNKGKATHPRVGMGPGLQHHEFLVFGGYDWNTFPNFPRIVGEAAHVADADGNGSTGGSYIGVGMRFVNWRFSVCRHVSVLHYVQQLEPMTIDGPAQVEGRLTGNLYDFVIGRDIPIGGNTYIGATGGYTVAYDKLDLHVPSVLSAASTAERSLVTNKLNLELSVRHALTDNLSLDAGIGLHTSGRTSEDADFERTFRIGASYGFRY